MLKKYSQFFFGGVLVSDALFIFISWVLAYVIRFDWRCPYPHPPNLIISFPSHLSLLWIILPVCILIFNAMGLYEPKRTISRRRQISEVIKISSIAVLSVAFIIYFVIRKVYYSRLIFLFFWLLAIIFLSLSRLIIYAILRRMRRKGYNLRHILIVGAGTLAQEVARKVNQHSEFGLDILGFLSDKADSTGKIFNGIRILGTYKDIKNIITQYPIDQVIFALPMRDQRLLRALLGYMDTETIDVRVILDIDGFMTLRKKTEDLDGLTVISLRESPFYGWARLAKRLFDIIISLLALIISSPVILLIMLLIKATSAGPVFYKQERLGLDGKKFQMIKFRTMRVDVEKETGPAWSQKSDARRTGIGAILRKASLDEIPQLFNVLRGDMSLVGPRPERPVFVEEFKKRIPQYMLRHKIKTGMTGWAQAHGLRGDTSIEKRIEYDIYYIEHWSIWLDLKILLLTIPAVFRREGAY